MQTALGGGKRSEIVQMDTKTKVINIKSGEPYDIYIGRAMPGYVQSLYHNPIRLVPGMTREECLQKLLKIWSTQPELIARMRNELLGKRLGCWCAPQMCHGHLIVELIEGVTVEQQLAKKRSPQLSLFG